VSDEYWLADAEARVLGPVGLEIVRDLAVRGKLAEVRAVSKDGRTFVPVSEVPEILTVLSPGTAEERAKAQAETARQIRNWLDLVKDRQSTEVFKVSPGTSREGWRSAFFALVHRYVPGRLPPDATPELRLACEDAFLHLAERMVDLERLFRASQVVQPPVMVQRDGKPPEVTWRGGMIHVRYSLGRNDARPFTMAPDHSYKDDCIFVPTAEKVMVGTPAEVVMLFEGHVTQLHASGRVVGVRAAPEPGLAIKLLDLHEVQRSLIRTWVARSPGTS
jgi:hypothetical protein